ncbi:DUF916 domain-containing protein [Pilibacter termitis]|nr:DUF916 domain-containing protein [Pilibacter termitis]
MKKLGKFIALAFIATLFTTLPFTTKAEDKKNQSPVGYFIGIRPSELQRDKNKTYFDLRVKPDTKTTLDLIITNTSDKDAKFHVGFGRAGTNSNQVITYDDKTENKEKAPADIKDMVKVTKTQVEIKAKSDVTVPIELDVKGAKWDGMIAGGITVTKVLEEQKEGYNNVYSYLKALALTQNDTKITPELKLNGEKGVANFGYNQIAVNLSNIEPVAFELEKIEGTITSEKDNSKVTVKKGEGQVAPNSSFDVLYDYKEVVPKGWYNLDMWVYAKNGQKWHFTNRFEIKEVKENYVDAMIQQGLMKEDKGIPWWMWLIAGLLLLLLFFLFFILFKRRKKEKEEEKQRAQMKELLDAKEQEKREKERERRKARRSGEAQA